MRIVWHTIGLILTATILVGLIIYSCSTTFADDNKIIIIHSEDTAVIAYQLCADWTWKHPGEWCAVYLQSSDDTQLDGWIIQPERKVDDYTRRCSNRAEEVR